MGGKQWFFFHLMEMSSLGNFDPAASAQRVVELPRNNIPEGALLGEVLGLGNQNPHIKPPASPCANLSDPFTYLQFFVITSDFSVVPDARRRHRGASLQRGSEIGAWKWVFQQIRACAVDTTLKHAGLRPPNLGLRPPMLCVALVVAPTHCAFPPPRPRGFLNSGEAPCATGS